MTQSGRLDHAVPPTSACGIPSCTALAAGFFRFGAESREAEVFLGSPTREGDVPVCEYHLFSRIVAFERPDGQRADA